MLRPETFGRMQAHKLLAIAAALLCVVHVQGAEDHSAHVKGEVIVTLPMKLADFTVAKQASYVVRHPASCSLCEP
jgi:hypothetical protein